MSSPQHEPVEVPQAVVDYLSSERTMTLATSTPGGVPYATTFLYVNEGPTIYFWTRASTIAARHIEANPTVAFTIDSYTGDLGAIRGVQGTGECSVLLNGMDIAQVADLFGQRFPDLQPGTTMSISFFRIAPTNLNYIDNTEDGAAAAVGASLRALAISHSFRRSCELLRGRAISAYSMTLMAAPVLGAGLSGVAAIHWGAHATTAGCGLVCVAFGWRLPGLRTEARRVIDAAERQPGAEVV